MVFEPMLLPPKMFPSRVIVGAAPSKVKLHVFWNDKPKASVMFAVKVWLPFPAGVTNEPLSLGGMNHPKTDLHL